MDTAEIAKHFVEFYYKTFDENRKGLTKLYRENSLLTFESNPTAGSAAIVKKLTELPFARVKHQVGSMDEQPSGQDGIIILVTGSLLVDEEQEHGMSYVQSFHLMQDPAGAWFVFNDLFKLLYSSA